METESPWVSRFPSSWSDDHLNGVIATPAGALPNLDVLPLNTARTELIRSYSSLTVPTRQMREAVRRMLERAAAAARELFPDQGAFLRRIYSNNPDPCSQPMMCITSLAGCGKSKLAEAFVRALPQIGQIDIAGHSRFRMVSGYRLTARAGIGLRQILEPIFPDPDHAGRSVFTAAQIQLAKDAVTMLVPDELQFVTQSASAVQLANLLLKLAGLGPPVAFITNYSLIHRLIRRPQELRDRLFSEMLVLSPDEADSVDWVAHLLGHFEVHDAFQEIAARADTAVDIHRRTFGIKRNVPNLLSLAYCASREDDSEFVRPRHIERAYLHRSYASARSDVELLLRSHITGLEKREDLWCPLKGLDLFAPSTRAPAVTLDLDSERLAQAALLSSMNAEDSSKVKSITRTLAGPTSPGRRAGQKITATSLAAGARALENKFKQGSGGSAV